MGDYVGRAEKKLQEVKSNFKELLQTLAKDVKSWKMALSGLRIVV